MYDGPGACRFLAGARALVRPRLRLEFAVCLVALTDEFLCQRERDSSSNMQGIEGILECISQRQGLQVMLHFMPSFGTILGQCCGHLNPVCKLELLPTSHFPPDTHSRRYAYVLLSYLRRLEDTHTHSCKARQSSTLSRAT